VALCDSIIKKKGSAEKNIYNYYVHSFFNKGTSDMYENVILKSYTFAKSVFAIPNVKIPTYPILKVIARYPLTTGRSQSVPVGVIGGITVSDLKIWVGITSNFVNDAPDTLGWDGFSIYSNKYMGFEITSKLDCSFKLTQIDMCMKKNFTFSKCKRNF